MKTASFLSIPTLALLLTAPLPAAEPGPKAGPAPAAEACGIQLVADGRPAWSLEVGPKKITGDKTSLTLDGNVLYGMLWEHPTRLIIGQKNISGNLAGITVNLFVKRTPDEALVRGPIGQLKSSARATPGRVALLENELMVDMKGKPVDRGQAQGLKDSTERLVMTFTDCDTSLLIRRPEVLLLLNYLAHHTDLVLPIAPEPPGPGMGP